MKKYTRLNKYKASNVEFDLTTNTAWSYGHWCFYKIINAIRVFNAHSYSVSTSRH